LGCLRVVLGTPLSFDGDGAEEDGCDIAGAVGSFRRALNEDINSIACGDSPRKSLKCSIACCLLNFAA
jgi:hypothetical protein